MGQDDVTVQLPLQHVPVRAERAGVRRSSDGEVAEVLRALFAEGDVRDWQRIFRLQLPMRPAAVGCPL